MRYYTQAADGEWIQPIKRGYRVACCECSLVHEVDFRIVDGRVQFRAWRDGRATAAKRRGR